MLCSSFLAASAIAAATVTAPPLKIDLNAFDAGKKSIALPNGESLAYIDTGKHSGRAVVLIHGYTDNARDWVPMRPYLSKRYRLILVDIRGHGQSGKPECCYTRFDYAYDITLLLDALGVRKADIVGHSLGSIIAQTFAEYWPERTQHIVLISSTGGSPPDRPRKPPQFDFRLKAPTLLIWGSKDPIMEEDVRQTLRSALPNANVKIFDGLGHNPFWEDPRGVADAVNAFLNTPI